MFHPEKYNSSGFLQINVAVQPELKRDAYEVLRQRGERFNTWLRGKMIELVEEHYERQAWEMRQEQEQGQNQLQSASNVTK
jgi:hypothetical protein